MTVPAKTTPAGEIMESVIIKGDLGKLTPEERTRYYNEVCRSIGLNPLTQPLQYLTLSGRLTLYARRDAADQLRKINGISLEIVSEDMVDGLLTVHVRAKDRDGRQDEDLGVVALPDTMKGEARANQILKAVTKAKRRVTLSISGLGFLDETEIEDIPAASKAPVAKPNVMVKQPHAHPFNPEVLGHDPTTGEITQSAVDDGDTPPSAPTTADAAPPALSTGGAAQISIEDMARNAAARGEDVFRTFYRNRSGPEQARVNAIGDELREIMDAVPKQE